MGTLGDPFEEARRILEEAGRRGLTLRLLGGIAVAFRCPSARREQLKRRYMDIDFFGLSKQSGAVKQLFLQSGYKPRERFNAMMGSRRMIFNDLQNSRRADVFLDVFEMCHRFDFRERAGLEGMTLPLADLLATKLQIVEINDKDIRDIVSLLLDHEVGSGDGDLINRDYIASLCSDDWGVYRTFTANLSRVAAAAGGYGLGDEEVEKVRSRAGRLASAIEETPKGVRWRLRARVGERVRWYELPEGDKPLVTGVNG